MPGSVRKIISLRYGVLAAILLVVLVIGSSGRVLFGGLALPWLAGNASTDSETTPTPARAWIGVTYIPLTPASARSHDAPVTTGALVVTITPNSPAAKAGIQEGDIIKAVSGQTINDSTSLMDAIRDKKPNDRVQVTLLRDGNEQTVEVALGRSPGSRTNRTPFDRLRSGFTKILARQ